MWTLITWFVLNVTNAIILLESNIIVAYEVSKSYRASAKAWPLTGAREALVRDV